MKRIVLLRHGESPWNKENRFTGWTDVDLSEKGAEEARRVGDALREVGFSFEAVYTSYLKRTVKTLNRVLDRLNKDWILIEKTRRLNEKHYDTLQGLNRSKIVVQYGEEQVHIWQRSYDVTPAPVGKDDPRNSGMDICYADVPDSELPRTKFLKDIIGRVMPYWKCIISPALMYKNSLLVVAHGNSLRGITKHLKGISDTDISSLNPPTAASHVSEFDDRLVPVEDYYLGNPEEIRKWAEVVIRQGMAEK